MFSHPGMDLHPLFPNIRLQNKGNLETPPSSSLMTNPRPIYKMTSLEAQNSKNKEIGLMLKVKKWKNNMIKTLLSRNAKKLTDYHYKLLGEEINDSFKTSNDSVYFFLLIYI